MADFFQNNHLSPHTIRYDKLALTDNMRRARATPTRIGESMALFTLGNISAHPISEGDAGLVLKKDGTFQIFNTHAVVDSANMTERQVEQTETLMAFAVALQIPEIMSILKQMAHDPAIVGDRILDLGPQH